MYPNCRAPLEYELVLRQEPKQARMCGVGGKADRRPIDPPPIVQLKVSDKERKGAAGLQDGSFPTHTEYLQNPYYFMFASLAKPHDDTELHWLKDGRTRCTTGSVVSSLYHLKDPSDPNEEVGLFVFPDLSVRTEGSYRLKLSLFEVVGNSVRHCKSVFSAPFYVYTAKKFPGMEESTPLSCSLADQGIKIRVRRDVRVRRKPRLQDEDEPVSLHSAPTVNTAVPPAFELSSSPTGSSSTDGTSPTLLAPPPYTNSASTLPSPRAPGGQPILREGVVSGMEQSLQQKRRKIGHEGLDGMASSGGEASESAVRTQADGSSAASGPATTYAGPPQPPVQAQAGYSQHPHPYSRVVPGYWGAPASSQQHPPQTQQHQQQQAYYPPPPLHAAQWGVAPPHAYVGVNFSQHPSISQGWYPPPAAGSYAPTSGGMYAPPPSSFAQPTSQPPPRYFYPSLTGKKGGGVGGGATDVDVRSGMGKDGQTVDRRAAGRNPLSIGHIVAG